MSRVFTFPGKGLVVLAEVQGAAVSSRVDATGDYYTLTVALRDKGALAVEYGWAEETAGRDLAALRAALEEGP